MVPTVLSNLGDPLMGARPFLIGAVLAALCSTAAFATVTVTNRDDKEHKLTIIEGETKSDRVLKPNETLNDICAKGCIIRLNDSETDEYELDGSETVSIEEGFLYDDTPEPAPEAPKKEEDGKK
jgi:hypothetical protein